MKAIGLKICVLAFLMVVINGKAGRWKVLSPKSNSSNHEGKPNAPKFIYHEIDDLPLVDDVESYLADAVELTKAIKAMLNVLKHSCFVDKEVKDLLEASRTFGLLVQESFLNGYENSPEMKALKDVKDKLIYEMNEDAFQFMNVPDNDQYFVKESIVKPIKALQSQILEVLKNSTGKNLNHLKEKCHSNNPITIAKNAMSKLDNLIAIFVDKNVPDRDDYLDLKKVYTVAFKKLIAFYSVCNTFHNQTTASPMLNGTDLQSFVHEFKAKFTKSYWSTRRITNDIKTQIKIGGTNSEIAYNIYDELMDEYKDL
uniref:Uncharacterized protein n=1 Tax=Panagrolaimus davidi TaxID=227884 RepID=A0A914QNF8_9BILA